MMEIPEQIRFVIDFLEGAGFVTLTSDADNFGNITVICQDDSVVVRLLKDKGDWFIDVSDSPPVQDGWYDMALLSNFLGEDTPDVLSLPQQAAVLVNHWDAIHDIFNPIRAKESRARLEDMREERAKRRFPTWFQ